MEAEEFKRIVYQGDASSAVSAANLFAGANEKLTGSLQQSIIAMERHKGASAQAIAELEVMTKKWSYLDDVQKDAYVSTKTLEAATRAEAESLAIADRMIQSYTRSATLGKDATALATVEFERQSGVLKGLSDARYADVAASARQADAVKAAAAEQVAAARAVIAEETKLRALRNSLPQVMRQGGEALQGVGNAMTMGLTVPILAIDAVSVIQATKFAAAMADVRLKVQLTDDEAKRLGDDLLKMTLPKELGGGNLAVPASQLTKIAEIAGQLGVKGVPGIEAFTKVIATLGITAKVDAEQGALALGGFLKVTGEAPEQVGHLGDALQRLQGLGASSVQEILDMASRLAGPLHAIGANSAEILGLANALTALRIPSELGATAVNRAMIQMYQAVEQNTKQSQAQLKVFAAVSGETSKQFQKDFGTDPVKAFDSFVAGLARVKAGGGNMIDVLDAVGMKNIRIRQVMLQAAGGAGIFAQSVKAAGDAALKGGDMDEALRKRTEAADKQWQLIINTLNEFAIRYGNDVVKVLKDSMPVIDDLLKDLDSLLKSWDSQSDGMKKMEVEAGLVLAALGPLTSAIGTAVKIGGGFLKVANWIGDIGVAIGKLPSLPTWLGGGAVAEDVGVGSASFFPPAGMVVASAVGGHDFGKVLKSAQDYGGHGDFGKWVNGVSDQEPAQPLFKPQPPRPFGQLVNPHPAPAQVNPMGAFGGYGFNQAPPTHFWNDLVHLPDPIKKAIPPAVKAAKDGGHDAGKAFTDAVNESLRGPIGPHGLGGHHRAAGGGSRRGHAGAAPGEDFNPIDPAMWAGIETGLDIMDSVSNSPAMKEYVRQTDALAEATHRLHLQQSLAVDSSADNKTAIDILGLPFKNLNAETQKTVHNLALIQAGLDAVKIGPQTIGAVSKSAEDYKQTVADAAAKVRELIKTSDEHAKTFDELSYKYTSHKDLSPVGASLAAAQKDIADRPGLTDAQKQTILTDAALKPGLDEYNKLLDEQTSLYDSLTMSVKASNDAKMAAAGMSVYQIAEIDDMKRVNEQLQTVKEISDKISGTIVGGLVSLTQRQPRNEALYKDRVGLDQALSNLDTAYAGGLIDPQTKSAFAHDRALIQGHLKDVENAYKDNANNIGNVAKKMFTGILQAGVQQAEKKAEQQLSQIISQMISSMIASAMKASSGSTSGNLLGSLVGGALGSHAFSPAGQSPTVAGINDGSSTAIPHKAMGGDVFAGVPFIAGDPGPNSELIMPKTDGHVFTASQTKAMMGEGGTHITENHYHDWHLGDSEGAAAKMFVKNTAVILNRGSTFANRKAASARQHK